MENRGSMYRMKEFSAMTGLPQSKIRFYEKHGLILSDRQENGYRVFTISCAAAIRVQHR